MNVQQMRDLLLSAYPMSASWALKVRKMDDDQVMAVFFRLLKQNKIKGV